MSILNEDKVPMVETTSQESSSSWKGLSSLDEAKHLVDVGALLTWKDYKQLRKIVASEADLKEFVSYCAVRLAERVESRLPEEILIESLLVIFANAQDEEILVVFLQELLMQPNRFQACQILVELAITAEVSDAEHAEEIFSTAVALICELGHIIRLIQLQQPTELGVSGQKLLDHISTYLLSVSNSNDNCIRLSLLHYFGSLEKGKTHKAGFNRIMSRFGHTVLEHLFTLLFNKKTEAVALQFLLENIPFILEADDHAQTILQETWKHYLLKKPERFALFIQALTQYLAQMPDESARICRKTYLQHLALLLKKVAEVDHKELGREILSAIATFHREPFFPELIRILSRDLTIRESFRSLLRKMAESRDMSSVLGEADSFKSSKRGRKPSFAKTDKTRVIYQVKFLGQQLSAKAS
jgi:hypothetical protein